MGIERVIKRIDEFISGRHQDARGHCILVMNGTLNMNTSSGVFFLSDAEQNQNLTAKG